MNIPPETRNKIMVVMMFKLGLQGGRWGWPNPSLGIIKQGRWNLYRQTVAIIFMLKQPKPPATTTTTQVFKNHYLRVPIYLVFLSVSTFLELRWSRKIFPYLNFSPIEARAVLWPTFQAQTITQTVKWHFLSCLWSHPKKLWKLKVQLTLSNLKVKCCQRWDTRVWPRNI